MGWQRVRQINQLKIFFYDTPAKKFTRIIYFKQPDLGASAGLLSLFYRSENRG